MKQLLWAAWVFIAIICLEACRKETPAAVEATPLEDSISEIVCDSDTIVEDAPPAAADGLFADFIYDFMRPALCENEREGKTRGSRSMEV